MVKDAVMNTQATATAMMGTPGKHVKKYCARLIMMGLNVVDIPEGDANDPWDIANVTKDIISMIAQEGFNSVLA